MHGCNTRGVMGAGVAKSIRAKWPGVFDEYKERLNEMRDFLSKVAPTTDFHLHILGWVVPYQTPDRKVIANIMTQPTYGRSGKHARYMGIARGLNEFFRDNHWLEWAKQAGFDPREKPIAIPKIGCTNGGLSWSFVKILFEEHEEKFDVNFRVYEL